MELITFLKDFAVTSFGDANVVAFTGTPSPGKWFIPKEKYDEFLNLVKQTHDKKKNICRFIEKHRVGLPSRVIIDLDGTNEFTLDHYRKIFNFTYEFFESDNEIMIVKSADSKIKKKYSSHIIFPNLALDISKQAYYAQELKYNLLSIGEEELSKAVDMAIYENNGERGLRLAYCDKGEPEYRPTLPRYLFTQKDGKISVRTSAQMDIDMKSMSIQYGLPQESITNFPIPENFIQESLPKEKSDELTDILKAFVTRAEKKFKCRTSSCKINTDEEYGKSLQINLKTTYCDIKQGTHDREDGRCIILNSKNGFYCCLNVACKGKQKKLGQMYKKNELEEAFGEKEEEFLQETPPELPTEDMEVVPKSRKRKTTGRNPQAKRNRDPTGFQLLVDFMYEKTEEFGYSRRGEFCVTPKLDINGKNSGYYEKVCKIEDLILREANRDKNREQYDNRLSASTNTEACTKEMMRSDVAAFPSKPKHRSCYSFNGYQYNACTRTFESHDVDHEHASSNYFNHTFDQKVIDDPEERLNLQVPAFQEIFTYQGLTEEEFEVVLFMIGESLHKKSKHDNHQHFLYLEGPPGTGKSTVLQAIARFHEAEDVGTIQADAQKEFSLQGQDVKHLLTLPDLDKKPGVMLSVFLSMAAGNDRVNINTKHKPMKELEGWETPIMASGNYRIGWEDPHGAVARRTVRVKFHKLVESKTTDFAERLKAELPNLIVRSNEVYWKMNKLIGNGDFMDFIPPYFRALQIDQKTESNCLRKFLESEYVEIDPKLYVPMTKFSNAFKFFCKEIGKVDEVWEESYYTEPLETKGIIIHKKAKAKQECRRTWPTGKSWASSYHGDFLFGVDLVNPEKWEGRK